MKFLQRVAIAILFLFLGNSAKTQQHFVYFQTDNRQPFYIKLDNNLYSSSTAGYLIIPRLVNGQYNLQLGFPKNEFPEQSFQFVVNGKDEGYLVKYFNDKGWGLYNLQTMELNIATNTKPEPPKESIVQSNDDEFSRTLSQVVNTPDLSKQQITKETKEANLVVTPVSKPNEVIEQTQKVSSSLAVVVEKPKLILKSGAEMIYKDGADTIAVLFEGNQIPNTAKIKENKKEMQNSRPVELGIDSSTTRIESKPKQPALVRSNPCKDIADQKGFLKLRKKMASRTSDFDMISDAMKAFKNHCFSSVQLRNLAVLFLNNQGRYSFLDAAYPYVSDPEKFAALKDLLSDEYFRNRFDAMIQKK